MDSLEIFQEAEKLLFTEDERALIIYQQIINEPVIGSMACFRLGEIYNRLRDAVTSFQYHKLAFDKNPEFTSLIVNEDHPSHKYIFSEPEEIHVTHCPLCGEKGFPYSVYNTTTSLDYLPGFNPIRLWMCCDSCHHLFAYNYPKHLNDILANSSFEFNLNPKTQLFPINSRILTQLSRVAPGGKLLEVGVGAGEFSAVAKEFLFDVTGLDIRPRYAQAVSKMLEIPVYTIDFQDFISPDSYDVLVMGDVIEHMVDPLTALRKAYTLLSDRGVLWLSTPNFESAFSMVKKDLDPMWRIVEHINYFSFRSLQKWLNHVGFEVIEYNVSSHYGGSMEVIAIKNSI